VLLLVLLNFKITENDKWHNFNNRSRSWILLKNKQPSFKQKKGHHVIATAENLPQEQKLKQRQKQKFHQFAGRKIRFVTKTKRT